MVFKSLVNELEPDTFYMRHVLLTKINALLSIIVIIFEVTLKFKTEKAIFAQFKK